MIWGLALTAVISTWSLYDLALCELEADYPRDPGWHNAATAAALAAIPWGCGIAMWFLVEVLA